MHIIKKSSRIFLKYNCKNNQRRTTNQINLSIMVKTEYISSEAINLGNSYTIKKTKQGWSSGWHMNIFSISIWNFRTAHHQGDDIALQKHQNELKSQALTLGSGWFQVLPSSAFPILLRYYVQRDLHKHVQGSSMYRVINIKH